MQFSQLMEQRLRAIVMGIGIFAEDLRQQEIEVVEIDWQPPASGNEDLMAALKKLS